MKVQTSRFGEIEVPDETLITFPNGIIGFKDAARFVIFECGDDGLFKWLQSCDQPGVAFVICEASIIKPDYQIIIGDGEAKLLELDNVEDGAVCLILNIPEKMEEATANLLGPIVMNAESRLGMQLVLINPDYSTKYPIFASGEESAEKETRNAGA